MTGRPLHFAADHPAFAGHFPARPILPGAILLAEVTEALRADPSAGSALGDTPRLGAVKFNAPCLPGSHVRIDWQVGERRIAFSATRLDPAGEILAASGHFEIDAA